MKRCGRVIALDGHLAKVSAESSSECRGCSAKSYCHGTEDRARTLTAVNRAGAQVGDMVAYDVDAGKVVLSAMLLWILPILALIAGYLVGDYFGGVLVSVLTAFGFMAISYLILKIIDRAAAGGTSFYPVITEILEQPPDTEIVPDK